MLAGIGITDGKYGDEPFELNWPVLLRILER
jgi:hypothetical protein